VLNRLEIDDELQIRHELAEHFIVWFRGIRDSVNVKRPVGTLGERLDRSHTLKVIGGAAIISGQKQIPAGSATFKSNESDELPE
jgi:hypothetical protein